MGADLVLEDAFGREDRGGVGAAAHDGRGVRLGVGHGEWGD